MSGECYSLPIQVKRGTQISFNDHKLRDGEPFFSIDTYRTFIGYNNETGAVSLLTEDVDTLESSRFYGSNSKSNRGFHINNNDIIFLPKQMELLDNATLSTVFTVVDCVNLGDSTSGVRIMFNKNQNIDPNYDIYVELLFSLSSGSISQNIVLTSDVHLLKNGNTVGTDYTYTDYIPVGTGNWGNVSKTSLTNLVVPKSDITPDLDKIIIDINRDDSETFTGDIDLINIKVYQAYNGSYFGFYCGGLDRTSEVDTSPTNISTINKLIFPFDNSNGVINGTLSRDNADLGSGCNSSRFGYVIGGFTTESDIASTIDKVDFTFDSGATSGIGNLQLATYYAGACNSSKFGYYFGGANGSFAYSNTIERINFAFGTFNTTQTRASLESNNYGSGGCNSSTEGYVVAGIEWEFGGAVSTVYKIPFATDSIVSLAATFGFEHDDSSTLDGVFSTGICNSSNAGYVMGGLHMKKVQKMTYPMTGASTVTVLGNLNASKSSTSCLNSSVHGYTMGGGHYANNSFYSVIERIEFAFDSSDAADKGNLTNMYDRGVSIDGTDFVSMFV